MARPSILNIREQSARNPRARREAIRDLIKQKLMAQQGIDQGIESVVGLVSDEMSPSNYAITKTKENIADRRALRDRLSTLEDLPLDLGTGSLVMEEAPEFDPIKELDIAAFGPENVAMQRAMSEGAKGQPLAPETLEKKQAKARAGLGVNLPKVDLDADDELDDLIRKVFTTGFKEDLSADALKADIVRGIGETFEGRPESFALTRSGQFAGSGDKGIRDYVKMKMKNRTDLTTLAAKNQMQNARLAIQLAAIKQRSDAEVARNASRELRQAFREKGLSVSLIKKVNSKLNDQLLKLENYDVFGNFKGFNERVPNAKQKAKAIEKKMLNNNELMIRLIGGDEVVNQVDQMYPEETPELTGESSGSRERGI